MSYDFPGFHQIVQRLRGIVAPPVTIDPPPVGVRMIRDAEVPVRDGTILRCNLFLPEAAGAYPVIISAHPYGKDMLPKKRFGGYSPLPMFRTLRQTGPLRISAWTGWEAPDPAFWVAHGYAVLNCDLRGFFRSEGYGDLMSDQEGQDYHDLIEWAAAQPWCSGKVGLNGVSYLALSQYKAAALRPPHLAAIVVWEGFSDIYRDLTFPGGIREDGFAPFWGFLVSRQKRCRTRLRSLQLEHSERDQSWQALVPRLDQIEVPALICGSFSDHNLHSGGSFRAFQAISSRQKWLYTHRNGKWAEYYSAQGLAFQQRFLDHFLKGEDNGMDQLPPVRLEVRDSAQTVQVVRAESSWPLASTVWTRLQLHGDGSLRSGEPGQGSLSFKQRGDRVSFSWKIDRSLELVGPSALTLSLESSAADVHVFVALRKIRNGQEIPFEGAYGFAHDPLSHGWLRASHFALDDQLSQPWLPVHTHLGAQPLRPGQLVPLQIPILPCATGLQPGDELRLDIQGEWFFWRNPLLGQFPSGYQPSPPGRATLHLTDCSLLLPITG